MNHDLNWFRTEWFGITIKYSEFITKFNNWIKKTKDYYQKKFTVFSLLPIIHFHSLHIWLTDYISIIRLETVHLSQIVVGELELVVCLFGLRFFNLDLLNLLLKRKQTRTVCLAQQYKTDFVILNVLIGSDELIIVQRSFNKFH